ncbi:hypothetical protein [Nonomuraea dietziae]|uniref:hypothetical protein n=1 Tax=Nonomuraea dietziae TaxID=65515 RepID=UPI003423535F
MDSVSERSGCAGVAEGSVWSGAVSEECSPSGSPLADAAGGRWPDAGVATGRAGVNVGGSGAGSGSQDSGVTDGPEEEVPLTAGSEGGGSQDNGAPDGPEVEVPLASGSERGSPARGSAGGGSS